MSPPVATAPSEAAWPADCEKIYSFRSYSGTPGTPFVVPAGMEVHPRLVFETPWDTDVQAVGVRIITDNKAILHHWNLEGYDGEFLLGWVPGFDASRALPLTPEIGMFLPTKGSLVLDVHYFNALATRDQTDASGLELCVIENRANFRKSTAQVLHLNGEATAPAHSTVDNVTPCTVSVPSDVAVLSVTPHMHLLGVHSKLELTRGETHTVLHEAPFEFVSQRSLPFDPPVTLKTGDVLTITCSYQNDTDRSVSWGGSTTDEMCVYYFVLNPMNSFSCIR